MKKIILSSALLALVSMPLHAMAADNSVYVSLNTGLGLAMDTDIDNMPNNAGTAKMTLEGGALYTGAVGFDFAGPLRAELEYGWQKNDLDRLYYSNRFGDFEQGDLKVQSLMVNGYFDVDTGSAWSPFIGVGLGMAKVDLNTPALPFADNDDVFALQVMAGVSYALNDKISFDAQTRFFTTQDATIQGADFSFASNDFMLGARYHF
jgi:opacity protein-like surface antigen